jgi:multiple sugar transport system permease protein
MASPGSPRGGRGRPSQAAVGILLLLPAAVLVAAFTVFPVIYNIWLGFHDQNALSPQRSWVGLGNYVRLLHDPFFWDSVRLGITYAAGSTLLQVILGVAAALVLHERFPGRSMLRGIALFPYVIPTVISVFIWRWLVNDVYGVVPYLVQRFAIPGMPRAWLGSDSIMLVLIFISVWAFFPFVLINVLARLQTIPPELYEAARVDGASRVKQLWHVTLPQLRNVLLVVVLLRGIWMFNKFDLPWLLGLGEGAGAAIRTLPVFTYQRAFQYQQAGMGAALSVVMFVFLLTAVSVYFVTLRPEEE